jgi:sensor domain CHASE-containing protein
VLPNLRNRKTGYLGPNEPESTTKVGKVLMSASIYLTVANRVVTGDYKGKSNGPAARDKYWVSMRSDDAHNHTVPTHKYKGAQNFFISQQTNAKRQVLAKIIFYLILKELIILLGRI